MAAVLLPVCKGGGGREGVARERLGSEGARREALAHNRDGRIRMRMRMVCAVVQSRRRSEVRPPTRSSPPSLCRRSFSASPRPPLPSVPAPIVPDAASTLTNQFSGAIPFGHPRPVFIIISCGATNRRNEQRRGEEEASPLPLPSDRT